MTEPKFSEDAEGHRRYEVDLAATQGADPSLVADKPAATPPVDEPGGAEPATSAESPVVNVSSSDRATSYEQIGGIELTDSDEATSYESAYVDGRGSDTEMTRIERGGPDPR